jgi:hypothetical protein
MGEIQNLKIQYHKAFMIEVLLWRLGEIGALNEPVGERERKHWPFKGRMYGRICLRLKMALVRAPEYFTQGSGSP